MLEDLTTCKCGTLTQDGSKSSDSLKVNTSQILRTRKFLMFQVEEIKKVITSLSGINTVV